MPNPVELSVLPPPDGKTDSMAVFFGLYRSRQADLLPQGRIDLREDGVALDLGIDLGEQEFIGEADCLGIDLAAANDG
jgi:hypothetical protein